MVRDLIQRLNGDEFYWACKTGQTRTVLRDLDGGGDPNRASGSSGDTGLHGAVEKGRVEIARDLIRRGRSRLVNRKNNSGWTPLHTVVVSEHRNRDTIAQMLLEANADMSLKNRRGETALDVARQRGSMGRTSIAALLQRHEARLQDGPRVNEVCNRSTLEGLKATRRLLQQEGENTDDIDAHIARLEALMGQSSHESLLQTTWQEGDRCINHNPRKGAGTVRYVGRRVEGGDDVWVGVELDRPRSDGSGP
eukprot:COSAG02_NODE_129_length_34796_cov_26.576015_14_plen_251_part_00